MTDVFEIYAVTNVFSRRRAHNKCNIFTFFFLEQSSINSTDQICWQNKITFRSQLSDPIRSAPIRCDVKRFKLFHRIL